jgi:hypothetical protein
MSGQDAGASIGPDVAREPAACTSGACGVPSAGAAIRRGVRGFAGKAILELGFDEMDLTRKAAALGTRYLCVAGSGTRGGGEGGRARRRGRGRGPQLVVRRRDRALRRCDLARALRPRGAPQPPSRSRPPPPRARRPALFSVPCATDRAIPAHRAMARSRARRPSTTRPITEAGLGVEEMTDAAGDVVFSARRR